MPNPAFFLIVIVIVPNVASHQSSRSDLRYFTGEKATLGQFPYVVYINKTYACTGVILDKEWVITTADCMVARPGQHQRTEIVAGIIDFADSEQEKGNKSQSRYVGRVFAHPKFRSMRVGAPNLALIQVDKPFHFNEYVAAVNISTYELQNKAVPAMSVGFGQLNSEKFSSNLFYHRVTAVREQFECNCVRRSEWKRLICLVGENDLASCEADRGGPLLYNEALFGINHMLVHKENCLHARDDHLADECGRVDVTTIYIYLCYYHIWLHKMLPHIFTMDRCSASTYLRSVCNVISMCSLLYFLQ